MKKTTTKISSAVQEITHFQTNVNFHSKHIILTKCGIIII